MPIHRRPNTMRNSQQTRLMRCGARGLRRDSADVMRNSQSRSDRCDEMQRDRFETRFCRCDVNKPEETRSMRWDAVRLRAICIGSELYNCRPIFIHGYIPVHIFSPFGLAAKVARKRGYVRYISINLSIRSRSFEYTRGVTVVCQSNSISVVQSPDC